MNVFPLFVDISQKNILVVGAGKVASRKIEKLLLFNSNIFVIGKKITNEIFSWSQEEKIKLEQRDFEFEDLNHADLVVVAIDDLALQKQIFLLCQSKKILCNCVDSPDYCSFLFPALIVKKDLVIGLSTGGKAPGFSAFLRRKIEKFLPNTVDEILSKISQKRKDSQQVQISTYEEKAARIENEIEILWNNSAQTNPKINQ